MDEWMNEWMNASIRNRDPRKQTQRRRITDTRMNRLVHLSFTLSRIRSLSRNSYFVSSPHHFSFSLTPSSHSLSSFVVARYCPNVSTFVSSFVTLLSSLIPWIVPWIRDFLIPMIHVRCCGWSSVTEMTPTILISPHSISPLFFVSSSRNKWGGGGRGEGRS